MALRFPSKLRLSTTQDFHRVFQNAKKRRENGILLYFMSNGLAYPRLGIVIAKRDIAKATRRNQIKRIIREGFRQQQRQLSGYDLIIMVKRQCLELDNRIIAGALRHLWQSLKAS